MTEQKVVASSIPKPFVIDEADYKYLGEYEVDSGGVYIGDAKTVYRVSTELGGDEGYLSDTKDKKKLGHNFVMNGDGDGQVYYGKDGTFLVIGPGSIPPWEQSEDEDSEKLSDLNMDLTEHIIDSTDLLWIGDTGYLNTEDSDADLNAFNKQLEEFKTCNCLYTDFHFSNEVKGLGFISKYLSSKKIMIKHYTNDGAEYDFFIISALT
jgi:hypothetical protein